MLNSVTMQGRLTREPELRRTQTGTEVTNFGIAVPRDFSEQGNIQTDFFEVIAWRTTAEFVSKHFRKGDAMILQGRLQQREYTDREGSKRKVIEIVADRVYFGSSKKSEAPVTAEDFAELDDEGELPF